MVPKMERMSLNRLLQTHPGEVVCRDLSYFCFGQAWPRNERAVAFVLRGKIRLFLRLKSFFKARGWRVQSIVGLEDMRDA